MPKKEDGFEKLARLIKEEGEEVRTELKKEFETGLSDVTGEIGKLRQERKLGFSQVHRRLDETIQPQLDEHAHRIKVLEDPRLSR